MSYFRRLIFVSLVLTVFGLGTISKAQADPLFFSNVVALQNGGSNQVDLFSNPNTTIYGTELSFLVDISGVLLPPATNTLQITYQAQGSSPIVQTFQIPLFGSVPPPLTLLFAINQTGATPQGNPAILTLDFLGNSPDFIIPSGPLAGNRVDSYTYSFNVVQPVPEPASIIFLGTGLAGVVVRWRIGRKLRSPKVR